MRQRLTLVVSVWFLFSASGCNQAPDLLEYNNPHQYSVATDVLWASPDGLDLTMDIYTPLSGKASYPVLLIFHGGAWLINDKSIMTQTAQYFATNSEYVVCNVNYRLLGDQANSITLDQIVEDALGAVLWVKYNINRYRGDSQKLAITGDSAGAHLAAMVVNKGKDLDSRGYSQRNLALTPTYLPQGKYAEDIKEAGGIEVQAALLSYGVFDLYQRGQENFESWKNPFWYFAGVLPRGLFGEGKSAITHPDLYKGISPIHTIPGSNNRSLPPQLLTVGSADTLTTPAEVKNYLRQLRANGHRAKYWEYADKKHAYLDSGRNSLLGVDFGVNAPPALDIMVAFLNEIFYPDLKAQSR